MILPFLIGAAVRFLFRKRQKGWIVSVAAAALALTVTVVVFCVPSVELEYYGILAYEAGFALLGSLLTGGVLLLVRRKKKNGPDQKPE